MLADEHSEAGGQTDEGIVRALQVGTATVARVRRRLVEHGLEAALNRQVQRNRRAKKLDGEGRFSWPRPVRRRRKGRTSWSLRLLSFGGMRHR